MSITVVVPMPLVVVMTLMIVPETAVVIVPAPAAMPTVVEVRVPSAAVPIPPVGVVGPNDNTGYADDHTGRFEIDLRRSSAYECCHRSGHNQCFHDDLLKLLVSVQRGLVPSPRWPPRSGLAAPEPQLRPPRLSTPRAYWRWQPQPI